MVTRANLGKKNNQETILLWGVPSWSLRMETI